MKCRKFRGFTNVVKFVFIAVFLHQTLVLCIDQRCICCLVCKALFKQLRSCQQFLRIRSGTSEVGYESQHFFGKSAVRTAAAETFQRIRTAACLVYSHVYQYHPRHFISIFALSAGIAVYLEKLSRQTCKTQRKQLVETLCSKIFVKRLIKFVGVLLRYDYVLLCFAGGYPFKHECGLAASSLTDNYFYHITFLTQKQGCCKMQQPMITDINIHSDGTDS